MALGCACITLAYTRAIAGLILGQVEPSRKVSSQRASVHIAKERMKVVSTFLPHNLDPSKLSPDTSLLILASYSFQHL